MTAAVCDQQLTVFREAELRLIIEYCAQHIVLLKLTTDRHEASLPEQSCLFVGAVVTLLKGTIILHVVGCEPSVCGHVSCSALAWADYFPGSSAWILRP